MYCLFTIFKHFFTAKRKLFHTTCSGTRRQVLVFIRATNGGAHNSVDVLAFLRRVVTHSSRWRHIPRNMKWREDPGRTTAAAAAAAVICINLDSAQLMADAEEMGWSDSTRLSYLNLTVFTPCPQRFAGKYLETVCNSYITT